MYLPNSSQIVLKSSKSSSCPIGIHQPTSNFSCRCHCCAMQGHFSKDLVPPATAATLVFSKGFQELFRRLQTGIFGLLSLLHLMKLLSPLGWYDLILMYVSAAHKQYVTFSKVGNTHSLSFCSWHKWIKVIPYFEKVSISVLPCSFPHLYQSINTLLSEITFSDIYNSCQPRRVAQLTVSEYTL